MNSTSFSNSSHEKGGRRNLLSIIASLVLVALIIILWIVYRENNSSIDNITKEEYIERLRNSKPSLTPSVHPNIIPRLTAE